MATTRTADDGYVDRWLKRSLNEGYASSLREPLTDELAELLREPQK